MQPFSQRFEHWKSETAAALAKFERDCDDARGTGGDAGMAAFLNCWIEFWLRFAGANEAIGRGIRVAEVRSIILENWPARDFDPAEDRALLTAVAYEKGLRLNSSGTKDTRIEAAMQLAAAAEGLNHAGAIETIRKSITRLRKRVRGTSLLRLDRETLEVTLVDAESAFLPHLPGRPGRPKKPLAD